MLRKRLRRNMLVPVHRTASRGLCFPALDMKGKEAIFACLALQPVTGFAQKMRNIDGAQRICAFDDEPGACAQPAQGLARAQDRHGAIKTPQVEENCAIAEFHSCSFSLAQRPRKARSAALSSETVIRGIRTMRIIGLAGWSGAGKTSLIIKLIPHFSGRGLTISTLKHAH